MFIPIAAASIPDGIHLLAKVGAASDRKDADRLLEALAACASSAFTASAVAPFTIMRPDQSRPRLLVGDLEVPVSLTHTDRLLIAAMGRHGWIGVDAERVDRPVHERLRQRMLHPAEASDGDIRDLPDIRLWTMKEAVLKWLGTGLRTSMKSIRIRRSASDSFQCITPDLRIALLTSFRWEDHWISLAWSPESAPPHSAAPSISDPASSTSVPPAPAASKHHGKRRASTTLSTTGDIR